MRRRLQHWCLVLLMLGVASVAFAVGQPAAKVDLNTATQDQLESLPGIGPAMAKRIQEYREANGGFKRIEDLMNVKGIGEKKFLRLKELVTAGGGEAAKPDAAPQKPTPAGP